METEKSNLEKAMQKVRDCLTDDYAISRNKIYEKILDITIKLPQGEMAQFWDGLRKYLSLTFSTPYSQNPEWLELDIKSFRNNLSELTQGNLIHN